MTAAERIERLASFGAWFILEGEELSMDIPANFPAPLIEEIRRNKAEIISFIRQEIDWRVKIMEMQIANHQGGCLPLLRARKDFIGKKGTCFSCGEVLHQGGKLYICQWCYQAKRAVLEIG